MTIIDTHAHADQLEDIPALLEEAAARNVEHIIAVAVDGASSRKNLELSKETVRPKIWPAIGIHPEMVEREDIEESLKFIKTHADQAVAIGEIGLDYWYRWVRKNNEQKRKQRDVFIEQLRIAKEHNKPAVVHSRGAWKDCLALVEEAGLKQVNFHWYSGPIDVLEEILAKGFFVSATPSLAYSPQAVDAISHAPIEQTLIETDSPVYFKSKEADEGFRASPKDVWKTLSLYVKLKKIDETKALEQLNKNAKAFFSLS